MTFSKYQKLAKKEVLEQIDEIYNDLDNKSDIDYWDPLSQIIIESVELRDFKGLTQSDLAKKMDTRQSAISRFENMGRIPTYDFIARLSISLENKPGMTLCGDYMAVVPFKKQLMVDELAKKENISSKKLIQNILEEGIENKYSVFKGADANSYKVSTLLKFYSSTDSSIEKGKTESDDVEPNDFAIAV